MIPLTNGSRIITMIVGVGGRCRVGLEKIGQWNVLQRITFLMGFGIANLLLLLVLWYWLVVTVEGAAHAELLESRLQLAALESENQGLFTNALALAPSVFFGDAVVGNIHNRPELSYLMDYLRDLAKSTQVHLLSVRPGDTDQNGKLSIAVSAEVFQPALANFWAGLMLNIQDVEVQQLDVTRIAKTEKYALAMSLLVSTGTYIDERRLLNDALLAVDDKDPYASTVTGKYNKGFILEKDSKRLVYLLGDNHGRVHRVGSK